MDPLTLRWTQVELTVGMDWYTRCITGLRLTPVSTKSVDAAMVLYQCYRPPDAPASWPKEATWPEHGIPRSVLLDVDAIDRDGTRAAWPAIVPESLIVDHGKIYVSEHLTSVCQRMQISIQPARLRMGRDKGPVERFFLTIRTRPTPVAPPAIKARISIPAAWPRNMRRTSTSMNSRRSSESGLRWCTTDDLTTDWSSQDFQDWTCPRRPCSSTVLPAPATSRPRKTPILPTNSSQSRSAPSSITASRSVAAGTTGHPWTRTAASAYPGGRWPVHRHPDDISCVHFRDPSDQKWHTLMWEHAPALTAPFGDDALAFARSLARKKYTYPNDELAMELLLERWNLGLGKARAERRLALRQSREDELLCATTGSTQQLVQALS